MEDPSFERLASRRLVIRRFASVDAEALASLDRGLADVAAGRVKPLAEYERERGL